MIKKCIAVSLEKAKEWYNSDNAALEELALQAFSKDELEKVELPKTWEEWLSNNIVMNDPEYYIGNTSTIQQFPHMEDGFDARSEAESNLLETEEQAEAILALIKLIRLRDCYRQGWKPDWTDSNNKYTVAYYDGKIGLSNCCSIERVLSFQSEEIRDEFFKNFKDLIEEVKPLF